MPLLKLSLNWLKSREVKSENGNRHLMWWTWYWLYGTPTVVIEGLGTGMTAEAVIDVDRELLPE